MDTGKPCTLTLPFLAYDAEIICDMIISYGWLAQHYINPCPRKHGLYITSPNSLIWVPGIVNAKASKIDLLESLPLQVEPLQGTPELITSSHLSSLLPLPPTSSTSSSSTSVGPSSSPYTAPPLVLAYLGTTPNSHDNYQIWDSYETEQAHKNFFHTLPLYSTLPSLDSLCFDSSPQSISTSTMLEVDDISALAQTHIFHGGDVNYIKGFVHSRDPLENPTADFSRKNWWLPPHSWSFWGSRN
jgi:hypothetical protein